MSELMRHNPEEGFSEDRIHRSVLWREIVQAVQESSGGGHGIFVDCTLGEGGHSRILLERFPDLKIHAFERDPVILEKAKDNLKDYQDRVVFYNDNFSEAPLYLAALKKELNYMLYDFGVSSFHFDQSGRGFAFKNDEPLDMRLSPDNRLTAGIIVNSWEEKELARIFYEFGEERKSRRIARYICARREESPINSTAELASVVLKAFKGRRFSDRSIHPATRVFQALRIAVNNELEAIDRAMKEAPALLCKGGRIMAISFHSLEDRIVKNRFRAHSRGCTCDAPVDQCICTGEPVVRILTKKPLVPEADEVEANPRSRSAKLRICEKI